MANQNRDMPFFNIIDDTDVIIQAQLANRRQWMAAVMAANQGSPPPLTADAAIPLPALLMQSLIIPASQSSEGRLVRDVGIAWLQIIRLVSVDPDVLNQIPWDKLEELMAGAYKKAGYDDVILTPRSGDLGRDVIATKMGVGQIRVIDQVKRFKPGHLVTADDVRALYGVLELDGASKGFLTTTSDFAPGIRTDPLLSKVIPSRIGLVAGPELFVMLKALAEKM